MNSPEIKQEELTPEPPWPALWPGHISEPLSEPTAGPSRRPWFRFPAEHSPEPSTELIPTMNSPKIKQEELTPEPLPEPTAGPSRRPWFRFPTEHTPEPLNIPTMNSPEIKQEELTPEPSTELMPLLLPSIEPMPTPSTGYTPGPLPSYSAQYLTRLMPPPSTGYTPGPLPSYSAQYLTEPMPTPSTGHTTGLVPNYYYSAQYLTPLMPPPFTGYTPGPLTGHTPEPSDWDPDEPWYPPGHAPEPEHTPEPSTGPVLELTPEVEMTDAEVETTHAEVETTHAEVEMAHAEVEMTHAEDEPEPPQPAPPQPAPQVVLFRGPATESEYMEWTFPQPDARVFTLDDQDLATRLPLDNARHPNMTPPTASLGNLEYLPLELNYAIISLLDMSEITVLRGVNKRTRLLVDCEPHYARLFRECPDIIRAIIGTQAKLTPFRVHEALKEEKCSRCNGFGSLLHITSVTRICVTCLRGANNFHPVTEAQIKQAIASRGRDDISALPSILSITGTYGPSNKEATSREKLWHLPDIQDVAPGLLVAGQCRAPDGLTIRDRETSYRRFMTVISAPVLNPRSDNPVDWGAYCHGCRGKDNLAISRFWGAKYTRKCFDWHVMRHGGLEDDGVRFEHTVAADDVVPEPAQQNSNPRDAEAGWRNLIDKKIIKVPGGNMWWWNTNTLPPNSPPVIKTALEFHLDGTISAAALRVAQDLDTMRRVLPPALQPPIDGLMLLPAYT